MEDMTMCETTGTDASTKEGRAARRKTRCMFKDDRGRWWLDYYTPNGKRRRQLIGSKQQSTETNMWTLLKLRRFASSA
jgi:hypothetical protein